MRRPFPLLTALFVAALFLGGADGCSSDPDVEGAKLYIQQEDFTNAMARLDAALARNPDNADAHALRAEVARLQAAEETDAAARRPLLNNLITSADRVRALAPDNADVARTRLAAWANEMQLGGANLRGAQDDPIKLANAIGSFENAIMVLPDSAGGHFNLGLAHLVAGHPAEAIAPLEGAIERGITDVNAFVYLGRAYLAADRGNDAVTLLERGRTLHPDSAELQADLLNAYAATGQSDRALGAYQEAINNDPDNALLYYNYGSVLLQAERYEEAIPQLIRATELDQTNASAYYNLGAAYQNQAAALNTQMRALPSNDTANYERLRGERDALLRLSMPQFEAARRISGAAGESEVDVCRALFRVYTTLGMTAQAQEAGTCAGEDMN
ncbi:MAG TPA: tetratricopeptide repeat protein [Rhodothermales bacterium]|nr:tetratricopeptide repeat protein [Rhodothermales bacterium]